MNASNKTTTAVLESSAAIGSATAERRLTTEGRLILERRKVLSELAAQECLQSDELAEGWQEIGSPSEDTSREIEYGRRDALHHRLANVNEALGRLLAGKYGVCDRCKSKIGDRRLEADPAALLCLRCQSFLEGDFKSKSL